MDKRIPGESRSAVRGEGDDVQEAPPDLLTKMGSAIPFYKYPSYDKPDYDNPVYIIRISHLSTGKIRAAISRGSFFNNFYSAPVTSDAFFFLCGTLIIFLMG